MMQRRQQQPASSKQQQAPSRSNKLHAEANSAAMQNGSRCIALKSQSSLLLLGGCGTCSYLS